MRAGGRVRTCDRGSRNLRAGSTAAVPGNLGAAKAPAVEASRRPRFRARSRSCKTGRPSGASDAGRRPNLKSDDRPHGPPPLGAAAVHERAGARRGRARNASHARLPHARPRQARAVALRRVRGRCALARRRDLRRSIRIEKPGRDREPACCRAQALRPRPARRRRRSRAPLRIRRSPNGSRLSLPAPCA